MEQKQSARDDNTTNQVDSKQMVRFTFIVQPIDPTKKNNLDFFRRAFPL